MKKICMVTTSNIDYDTRILNEAAALSSKYQITILSKKYNLESKHSKTSIILKRINYLNHGPFLWRILSSFYNLTKAAFKENPDVYHAHDLDGLLCAFLPALWRRKILIYDSHELWTGLFSFSNLRGVKWLIGPLEKILMTKVKYGITVNDSLARILNKKYHKEFIVVRNCPIIGKIKKTTDSLAKQFRNKKIILHLGGTGEGRGIAQIEAMAKYLPKNMIVVILGAEDDREKCNVIYRRKVAPNKILSTIKGVTVGLALTQNQAQSFYYSLPNKLFQYIAAEIPVLGSNFPEFKKVILGNDIGEVVDPSKPKLIAEKIIEMAKTKNQDKYQEYLKGLSSKKYNWDLEGKELVNFYQNTFKT